MTYHQLDGHDARPVEVQLDDGIWAPRFLEAYRKVEGATVARVRIPLFPRVVGRVGLEPTTQGL